MNTTNHIKEDAPLAHGSGASEDTELLQRLSMVDRKLRRELVFGFVCPIGADRDTALELFTDGLERSAYLPQTISVSALLEEYVNEAALADQLTRKQALMDVGDEMRRQWNSNADSERGLEGEAVALRALVEVRKRRDDLLAKIGGEHGVLEGVAYVIDSLKHPDELEVLRRIYGPAFYAIGLYSPKKRRRTDLLIEAEAEKESGLAESLIERDLHGEENPFGQHVEDAFHECDFILKASENRDEVQHEVDRFVKLVFGDPQFTPTKEEVGMYLATALQARSGSLARQVGSAILRDDGSVVSVGTNEVARAISGGQYWADDGAAGSDLNYARRDTSDRFRAEAIVDILDKLSKLPSDFDERIKIDSSLLKDAKALRRLFIEKGAPLRKALIRDSIDRIRAVHAESAAISDAARHGVATKKTTMYVTTFPCHECARHIVAAGIREVVYLAPYPKSAVKEMYDDSIKVDAKRGKKKVTFRSFVGVAPRRYIQFFSVGKRKRKEDDGTPIRWDIKTKVPYLPGSPLPPGLVMLHESLQLARFIPFLKHNFVFPPQDTVTNSAESALTADGGKAAVLHEEPSNG